MNIRRTYGALSIARRHPRLFALLALHRTPRQLAAIGVPV